MPIAVKEALADFNECVAIFRFACARLLKRIDDMAGGVKSRRTASHVVRGKASRGTQSRAGKTSASPRQLRFFCFGCQRNISADEVTFCPGCGYKLCDGCVDIHRAWGHFGQ